MVESTTFGFGLLAGLVLGAIVTGLWLSTRLRSQYQCQLLGAAERAQRAETLAEELRRQKEDDHRELDRL
ncbi:MAG TPA: DNA recombination protein RmuC, partial [Nitrospira sp.]